LRPQSISRRSPAAGLRCGPEAAPLHGRAVDPCQRPTTIKLPAKSYRGIPLVGRIPYSCRRRRRPMVSPHGRRRRSAIPVSRPHPPPASPPGPAFPGDRTVDRAGRGPRAPLALPHPRAGYPRGGNAANKIRPRPCPGGPGGGGGDGLTVFAAFALCKNFIGVSECDLTGMGLKPLQKSSHPLIFFGISAVSESCSNRPKSNSPCRPGSQRIRLPID